MFHALTDPKYYEFGPRAWKALNPIWPAWLRMLNRFPLVYAGGIFGLGSRVFNGRDDAQEGD